MKSTSERKNANYPLHILRVKSVVEHHVYWLITFIMITYDYLLLSFFSRNILKGILLLNHC